MVRDLRKQNANAALTVISWPVVASSFSTRKEAETKAPSNVEYKGTRASDSDRLACDAVLQGWLNGWRWRWSDTFIRNVGKHPATRCHIQEDWSPGLQMFCKQLFLVGAVVLSRIVKQCESHAGHHSWAGFVFSHWLLSRVLLMRCHLVCESRSFSYMIYKFLIRVTGRFMTSVIFVCIYCSSRRSLYRAETYRRIK